VTTLLDLTPPTSLEQVRARAMSAAFEGQSAQAILRRAIETEFRGKIALSSSFGADAAVMLHLVSKIDPHLPVIFLDTDRHFFQTLQYRDELISKLGLTNIIILKPDPSEALTLDPSNDLWSRDPDACCALRKVWPLDRVMENYTTWISGRKRDQAASRAHMPIVEWDGRHFKLNPLADWPHARVLAYIQEHDLPPHPLVAEGYPSIGCYTCTSPVAAGEDLRAGRWAGTGKVECGIHVPVPDTPRPMAF
jgi:phosphoadenosine phosphosulfate reductase